MTIDLDPRLDARLDRLERQVRHQRIALVGAGLVALAATLTAATRAVPDVIDAHAIRIVDAAGHPRILLGAPAPADGRVRKDAQTASLVVLGPDGKDRVIVGEAPNPVIDGKTYPRIAASYGMIIHNQAGEERGGMSWLDNGRGVVALDRPNADAVALIVNEQSGFAGLTVNYAASLGRYTEGVRIGTKGDEAWLSLQDRTTERARLSTLGPAAPALVARPAGAPPTP